jgi:hypothetical protein
MTTSAAIAPGANSFSIALARGARSTHGSTSDPTANVMSPPDRDNAPASDSGSSEGSAFHSVLHQFYSQADSKDGNGDEKQSGGKDRKTKDATSLTAATMLFPLTENGTQFRNVPSIPPTSTNSDTSSQTSPEPTDTHSDPSTSDDTAKTSSASVKLVDPSLVLKAVDQQPAANAPSIPAPSDTPSDSRPPAQDTTAKKPSFVPRVTDPAATPFLAKVETKPKADFNGTKADSNGPKADFHAATANVNAPKPEANGPPTNADAPQVDSKSSQPTQPDDSAKIKNAPAASVDASPGDDSDFRGVLSQIYFSQPDASGSARPTKDSRVAEPASNPQPVTAKRSVSSAPPPAPQPVTTTPLPTPSATLAPVIATDPPAARVQPAKTKDSSFATRASVSLPPIETPTPSKAPAPSGELAFAARLTPTDGASESGNSTLPSDASDSKPPVPPMAERMTTASDSTRTQLSPARQRTASESNPVSSTAPDETDSKPPAPPTRTSPAPAQASDAAAPTDRSRPVPAAEPLVKAEVNTSAPQPVTPSASPAISPKNETSSPSPAPQTRTEHVIETPAPPQPSNRDITVRVPDATERGTDVRFVERGGEIRVMVRTSDTEMAQTLRGGLSEFVGRMEHTGIRAEVWRPGQDAPQSQGDSQNQQFEQHRDPRDSGSGKQHGSQEREDSRQQADKPGWVEEMETSLAPTAGDAIPRQDIQ